MFSIKMDLKPIEQLENDLDRFGEKALPFAVRDTLNAAAYRTSDLSRTTVEQKFTLRNTWTRRSIQYDRARGHRIQGMESRVGSTQEYMAKQETGFTTQKSGQHGIAIPTAASSGEGQARIRKRPIRRANQLSNIRIAKGLATEYQRKYEGQRQRLIRMIQDSIEYGFRTIFWVSKRSKRTGFYRIEGGRRTKRGWPDGVRLKMIYGVSTPTTITENGEWLEPASERVTKLMDELYRDAITRQIRLQRVFRDKR